MGFCAEIPNEIRFFVHHRTRPVLEDIEVPKNVQIYDSCSYSEMVKNLSKCGFVITDSGGINKTVPFFGKKALIMRENIEWIETEKEGYARKSQLINDDIGWLSDPIGKRDKRFYLTEHAPSSIIYNTIRRYCNDSVV
jgi:hypothetical protein